MKKGKKDQAWLSEFLEEQVLIYNHPRFIEDDPISIVHRFQDKKDIEIMGLLMATIAWGNRKSIIRSGERMVQLMEESPFDFIQHFSSKEERKIKESGFVHRTFNAEDFAFFCRALKKIIAEWGSPEKLFTHGFNQGNGSSAHSINFFRSEMLKVKHDSRQEKHISDPMANSAAKRLNMYLRWMVRNDDRGVDFGIWRNISPAQLSIPLDVHSGQVSRELGLLKRNANDQKSVEELDKALRKLDASDPVKFDFALFGLGAYGWKNPFGQK